MELVNNLINESAESFRNMQSDAARLAGKWEKTGLLEGLDNELEKNNMSLILENQAKQLLNESSLTGTGGTFAAGTGEQYASVVLPMVRKIFGQVAAQEFVSVQPMNLPSGLVFFLDFQYGTNKTPFDSGDSLYGNTGSSEFPFSTAADNLDPVGAGGLYGAGKFTYSTNTTSSAPVTVAIATASMADVNFDSRLSASVGNLEVKKLTIDLSDLSSSDTQAVRGFVITSGSTLTRDLNLASLTKVNGNNVEFFVTGTSAVLAHNATGSEYLVTYGKATTDNARGDFEAGAAFAVPNSTSETNISIPEINIGMRSLGIIAKTKKLKAVFTPELAQDLNAYQALDAEAEVTNIMSEYISLEIDLEILDMLMADALTTEFWSAKNNRVISNDKTVFEAEGTNGFYNTQGQWFQTLGTKLQKVSNKIHQLTLRGGANFMVISPSVATVIESIPGFASNSDGDAANMEYAFGVQKAGTLNSRYTVYKNPYMNENTILMGYRGTQFLEAGAVFAPYVPLIQTPLVYDPDTFVPRKGLLTRYAKKMLRPEFYGKVFVNGLNTL
tara:strand:- start:491 stop:2158 length:1668 start_codon:yes stop_codon:yes gene_type:complete